ncbi:DUF4397 domain-containing protein [Streptomyces sp. NPDC048182]|uniref:DUF4397 domain-containing protein n=1 Tax=Streptomyces sp. NPDC048182 TaxID=3365507 RepID=UPI0037193EAA
MNTRVAGAVLAAGAAVALSATAGAPAWAAPGAPGAAGDQATVSVLHGVPGLTVDVYAGDTELIPDFAPGTLTDPLKLDAGSYGRRRHRGERGGGHGGSGDDGGACEHGLSLWAERSGRRAERGSSGTDGADSASWGAGRLTER